MGSKSRRKGGAGERQVVHVFREALGRDDIARNIGQARDGGCDIEIGVLVVEAKWYRSLPAIIKKWYAQAVQAATRRLVEKYGGHAIEHRFEHIPVVVMRENNGQWLAMLALDDFIYLTDISLYGTLPTQPNDTENNDADDAE